MCIVTYKRVTCTSLWICQDNNNKINKSETRSLIRSENDSENTCGTEVIQRKRADIFNQG